MSLAKDRLDEMLDQLGDEELRRITEFTRGLLERVEPGSSSDSLDYLRDDPSFTVPANGGTERPNVRPIKGSGVPASVLLLRSRR